MIPWLHNKRRLNKYFSQLNSLSNLKINIVTRHFLIHMEKKTIFLELPAEMVDRIDKENVMGDRSAFISNLLERQLQDNITTMDASTELTSRMEEIRDPLGLSGEISLLNSRGLNLGKFDINTMEGFEHLAQKICDITDDPIVRMRALRLR